MNDDAWDNFWLAGTQHSTDNGVWLGLTPNPYRRTPEPSDEEILQEQGLSKAEAKRVVDAMEDWERERRYTRREYD